MISVDHLNSHMANSDAPLNVAEVARVCMAHGYMLDKQIGKGGNATVFLVKSLKYNCDFCVKVCKPHGKSTERENEIRTLMNLNHKNILCIYEYFEENDYLYQILEYCPGGSLADVVEHEGPLSYPKLVQICTQLCEAVKACHEANVAHRDIKPANVLLDQYGRPKLADFGLSGFYSNESTVHSRAGSLAYMAPEIFRKSEGHNPFKADIWALGVTFFYLAVGRLPWETSSLPELLRTIAIGYVDCGAQDTPRPLVKVLKGMINPDVSRRMTIDDVLACEMFTVQVCSGSSSPAIAVKRMRSRSLAGLHFVSNSPDKSNGLGVHMKLSKQLKSTACLLSFTPSFAAEGGQRMPARRNTFCM